MNKTALLFSIFSLLFCLSCSHKKEIRQPEIIDYSPVFPDDWMGYWEGTLEIFNSTGKVQEVPMVADHQKTNIEGEFVWALIYGEDKIEGRRDYLLKEIDGEKGHYTVDEKNSIFLDSYLIENKMISLFEVQGTIIQSVYTRERDHLVFEIYAMKGDQGISSGGEVVDGEEIPEVESFPVSTYQKAVLKQNTL